VVAYVAARAEGPPLPADLRVTVHFHPDRLVCGVPLLAHLAADGVYRSQFETGTGNGGLTAYPGGDRWRWEQRIFGGAYDRADPADRPKYGSLNHRRRATGGSVRFGSAHLRLRPETLARTTFCYPDSVFGPTSFATAHRCGLVAIADADAQDVLDDYIEAHVHGSLLLARDVEAVVLDPAFRGTDVEAAAARLPVPVEWHGGFRLAVDELVRHPEFRGPDVVEAGLAIAEAGVLDARIVGAAVAAERFDAQTLKRVWHLVARFGAPTPR
jgi:hypothetical protein